MGNNPNCAFLAGKGEGHFGGDFGAARDGEHGAHAVEPRLRPTDRASDTTNALPIFNYWETLEEIWKEQGPKIAARREQVLAELRAEEELRTNRSATS